MSENEKDTGNEDSNFIPGTATDSDVQDIVSHPESFGLDWDTSWDAASDTDREGKRFGTRLTLRKSVPLPMVVETAEGVAEFVKAFGPTITAKAINGTSMRVAAQGIARTMLLAAWDKDRAKSVTNDDIRAEVVRRVLLGQRGKGGGGARTKYVGPDGKVYASAEEASKAQAPRTWKGLDGKDYPTLLEAKQASVGYLVDQGFPVDMAQKAVAGMTE